MTAKTDQGQLQLAGSMAEEIRDVIAQYEGSVPLATAIGVLQIVQWELLQHGPGDEES